jgi:hypothetical protein
MIRNVHLSSCKVPAVLVRFELNLNFLNGVSKNIQIPNFIKICSVGTELFHADGRQTDTTKLKLAFDRSHPVVTQHGKVIYPNTI